MRYLQQILHPQAKMFPVQIGTLKILIFKDSLFGKPRAPIPIWKLLMKDRQGIADIHRIQAIKDHHLDLEW